MTKSRISIFAVTASLAWLGLAGQAAAASKVVIKGRGYGHGIGMSQYGAYGLALRASYSYDKILSHYYTGTTLMTVSPSPEVRVLLQTGRSSAVVSGVESAGTKELSPTKSYSVVRASATQLSLRSSSGKVILTADAPLRLEPSSGKTLRLRGTAINGLRSGRYRGALEVRPATTGGVNAINAVELEDYIRGVISAESPSRWPAATLQAQAVAARSYAITTSRSKKDGFDQYPDQRSQVYRGVAAEVPSTDAAVAATDGKVVAYRGRPVTTYFFSTSGGETENVENSFVRSPRQAWLVAVPDPFDSLSPYHRWTVTLTRKSITAKLRRLGLKGSYKSIKVLQRGVSPRIVRAEMIGTGGRTTVTGPQLRSALGLRDTWASFSKVGASTPEPTTTTTTPSPVVTTPVVTTPTTTPGGGTPAP